MVLLGPFPKIPLLSLALSLLNAMGDTKLVPFTEEPDKHETNKH